MDEEIINVGVDFVAVLTLVLVVSKKMGYITFSWWLVFLPVIVLVALVILATIRLFID